MVFVDLRNAFPSVAQDTLWRKLHQRGVAGPLVDWLRMLYARMRYVVRADGSFSEAFRALAGILIGDPASPILWDLFFADFMPPAHPDDVVLEGTVITYLAQADDVALMSRSRPGLQCKLDALERWCRRNGVEINVSKTFQLLFGPLPVTGSLRLTLMNEMITVVPATTYIGMTVCSTDRHIFKAHRLAKASAARRVANVTLSLESYIGSMPPRTARELYLAQLDPHLTYGCGIDLDVDEASLLCLEQVQLTYLRRVLLLSPRSPRVVLFAMMNIWPLRYRRLLLALRYLSYLIRDRPPLPYAALREGFRITALDRRASWWGDLHWALRALPIPVALDLNVFPAPDAVAALIQDLERSLATYVTSTLRTSSRYHVMAAVHVPHYLRPTVGQLLKMPPYLLLQRDRRKALTQLMACEHPYAVQTRRAVERKFRACRFCVKRTAVEDEEHVLFRCMAAPLLLSRLRMRAQMSMHDPNVTFELEHRTPWQFVAYLLQLPQLLSIFADHVLETFTLCKGTPALAVNSDTEWRALPL